MKCVNCQEAAQFFCSCEYLLLCSHHLPIHKDKIGHFTENLNTALSNSDSKALKIEIMKRLQVIRKSRTEISNKAKNLILKIESYCKIAFDELDNQKKLYLTLMNLNIFSKTLKIEAEKVLSTSFIVKNISIELKDNFEEIFNAGLPVILPKNQLNNFDDFRNNEIEKQTGIERQQLKVEFSGKATGVNQGKELNLKAKNLKDKNIPRRNKRPYFYILFSIFLLLFLIIASYDFNFQYFNNQDKEFYFHLYEETQNPVETSVNNNNHEKFREIISDPIFKLDEKIEQSQ